MDFSKRESGSPISPPKLRPLDFRDKKPSKPIVGAKPDTGFPDSSGPDSVRGTLPLTQKSIAYAESQRSAISEAIRENRIDPDLNVEAVIESIALMQTHEERWDTLKIEEIKIPNVEISLWSGFLKIFNPSNTERIHDQSIEKGDIFDIRTKEFDMLLLIKIRKSEKDSLTFCIIKSRIAGQKEEFTFKMLVKFPVRVGGMLEVYTNRAG